MASQVLSGNDNYRFSGTQVTALNLNPSEPTISYTNDTGQNVRIIINYMEATSRVNTSPYMEIRWGASSVFYSRAISYADTVGKNIAFTSSVTDRIIGLLPNDQYIPSINSKNMYVSSTNPNRNVSQPALPLELILAPGQYFAALCNNYNIVVIPENG